MKYFLIFLLFIGIINSVYIDSSITEMFNENEKVDVIVMFNDESPNLGMGIKGVKTNEINSFEIKTQDIITQLSEPAEKFRTLEIINGFSTEVTEEDFELIKNNPNVEGIYYNYPVYLFLEQSVPLINAPNVWNMQYNNKNITGKGQTVCLIDTGVDYTHPNLEGQVIGGWNTILDNSNYMDDHDFIYNSQRTHSHGTHCAGIIASTHPIYKGVAPDARIVAVKALNSEGEGTFGNVISGIEWCVIHKDEYNISIISMSLGGKDIFSNYCNVYDDFSPIINAINNATEKNISVVIATGNEYRSDGISSPACIQNAIRVTATTKNDLFADYANRGGNFNDIIAAPGSNIYSTIKTSIGFYSYKSGTSMSTPHVAGVIALYNQYYYDKYGYYVSPDEIKQKLNNTGKIIYDSLSDKNYARVDAFELFNSIDFEILSTANVNPFYNNSDTIYFEINFFEPVSSVYVNISLPNSTNEIIHLTNTTSKDYNGIYTIPNLHGNYSFVYVIDDFGLIDYSKSFDFIVLYDYICVNYSDCNSSLLEYEKVLLNSSLSLLDGEYFTFSNNVEFNCNNYEIYNLNYFEIIGENSSLKNCPFSGAEFIFNSTNSFSLYNTYFKNHSQIYFNNSIFPLGTNSILLNEKVISNSINTTANYKINKSCDGLEIDILRLNEITNSTDDFYNSDYFTTSCVNNIIEFNSTLNGSYTYNIFNLTVTNTTGGKTNTIYNYTYLFNITNNNIINDFLNFTTSNFNSDFNLNLTNSTLLEFNISKNISGNHTLNYSICSTKLNRCHDSNFTIEVLDVPKFNNVSISPYVISNNTNVTFNLNVSNFDSLWFNIYLPNGSSFNDFYYEGYNYTANQTGVHNITFYANDTFGYTINYDDYFEVLELEKSNLTFKDSKGNLTEVTLNLFYRNQKLFSNSLSNSSINIYDLIYDLEINFSKLKLKLNEVNLTFKKFELILDDLEYENYLLTYMINNSIDFTGNYTLEINYSNSGYTNEDYLELHKCSDWNFINNTCNGEFVKKNFSINKTTNVIIYSDNTFSSFSLLQGMYCGDGICNNGETCSTCKTDCGSCPSSGGSGGSSGGGSSGGSRGGGGGGGGGGGAGGSSILPKNARYKNITLDYPGLNVIETDDYKMYIEQNHNIFLYSFYSNCLGELCFEENCIEIKPFEFYETNSTNELNFTFKKQKLEYAQKLNYSFEIKNIDREKIKFYLNQFNNSRTNEDKCSAFLGYHISPCVDKDSCLFACRSIPLCTGLSYSEIFLNFSKFVYVNKIELNDLYYECYTLETNNTYEYKKCIESIYEKAKEIESSPLFGSCPTCLGICEDVNYSYDSLNEILILLNDYDKVISHNSIDISKYNNEADRLNSLLEKNIKINEKISHSNKEIKDLIDSHNNYETITEQEIKLISTKMDEILTNITLYNDMNCQSEFKKFLTLNHFNNELNICLSNFEIEIASEKIGSCEGCGEPNLPFILTLSSILIIIFFLFKKKYR